MRELPIIGTPLPNGGGIALANASDPKPTHHAILGRGGHRSVDTLAERDGITEDRREIGMTCHVAETGLIYVLSGGITNAHWVDTLALTAKVSDLEATNAVLTSTTASARRAGVAALFRNAKLAANWRAWMPLMAAAALPVLTTATASQISGGVEFSAFSGLSPEGDQCDYFTLLGCRYTAGSGFPQGNYLYSKGITGAQLIMPNAVEFHTDAPNFEVRTLPQKFSSPGWGYRLWVDGQLFSDDNVPTQSVGAQAYDRVTFPSARTRLIRLELYSTPFRGVIVPAGYRVWPADPPGQRRPRVMFLGDSFTEPTGPGRGSEWRGFVGLLGPKFRWDVWASGAGGTGYSNPGSAGRYKVGDRIGWDVGPAAPDALVFPLGTNDTSQEYIDTLDANLEAAYSLVDKCLPNIPVYALGPFWETATPLPAVYTVRDKIKAAAERHGYIFIDPINEANPWINANNKQSYHPTVSAAGTAVLGGGGIASVTITNGGRGHSTIPAITLSGGAGSGGALQARVDGRIMTATVFNGGGGYDGTATVELVGGGGSGATASLTIADGVITAVNITNVGTGYTAPPAVVITGPAGSGGAVAVAALEYIVTGADVISAGSYTAAPTLTFAAPSDGKHPPMLGHAYLAERLGYEMHNAKAEKYTVNPPPIVTGAAEALAWKTRAVAAGGSVSDATSSNVQELIIDLKKAGVWDLLDEFGVFAGSYFAALQPIKIGHGAASLTPVNITGLHYSETGATAGLAMDGTSRYLDSGFNTFASGLSLTDAHISVTCKGTDPAGTSRWKIGNADSITPTNCTGIGWISGGTIDIGGIGVGPVGGFVPNPGTGAKDGVLLVTANGSRSGDYYDDGVLIPTSANMGANAWANCNIFIGARNVAGTADANKYTGYVRAWSIGRGLTAIQAAAYAAAINVFGSKMGWA